MLFSFLEFLYALLGNVWDLFVQDFKRISDISCQICFYQRTVDIEIGWLILQYNWTEHTERRKIQTLSTNNETSPCSEIEHPERCLGVYNQLVLYNVIILMRFSTNNWNKILLDLSVWLKLNLFVFTVCWNFILCPHNWQSLPFISYLKV